MHCLSVLQAAEDFCELWRSHDVQSRNLPKCLAEDTLSVGKVVVIDITNEWMNESRSVVSDSLQPHGLYSPWNSPGQNTSMGNLSLLQGIFPTQGSNPGLWHCRQILYQLSHKGSPDITGVIVIITTAAIKMLTCSSFTASTLHGHAQLCPASFWPHGL